MSISKVSESRRVGLLAGLALAALLALVVALLAVSSYGARSAYAIPQCEVPDPPPICDGLEEPPDPSFIYTRKSDPARTEVTDRAGNWLATFSDGSYTVTLKGPSRTFSERTAAYPVTHSTWVRLLPKPFDGQSGRPPASHAIHRRRPRDLRCL